MPSGLSPLRADLFGSSPNQVAINVRHLPDAHTRFDLVQIHAHQALVIEKQQDADHPIVIERAHPFRINIRPVIDFDHVVGNAVVIRIDGRGRQIISHDCNLEIQNVRCKIAGKTGRFGRTTRKNRRRGSRKQTKYDAPGKK